MNSKIFLSVLALSISGATIGAVAQAASLSSETTIERSTTADVPVAASSSEQTSTTTTKRGILGRTKSETTTSSRSSNNEPAIVNGGSVKSKTTIETQKSSY